MPRELTTSEASQVGHATLPWTASWWWSTRLESAENLTLTELQAIFSGQKLVRKAARIVS